MKKLYKKPVIISISLPGSSFVPAIWAAASAAGAAASAVVARRVLRASPEDEKQQDRLRPVLDSAGL